VRLSACLDRETAKEYRAEDGRVYGLLTWTWCQALLRAHPDDSYADAARRVQALMFQERGDLQHAQLEGEVERRIFDGRLQGASAIAVRAVDGARILLDSGALHGLTKGSILRIRSAAELSATSIELTEVGATRSAARVVSGEAPQVGELFEEVQHVFPLPPLRISLRSDVTGDSELRSQIEATIAADPRLSASTPEAADLHLILSADSVRLRDARGEQLGGGLLPLTQPEIPTRSGIGPIRSAWDRVLHRRNLASVIRQQLDAVAGVSIELVSLQELSCEDANVVARAGGLCFGRPEVLRDGSANSLPLSASADARFGFRIRNDTGRDRYFYLFNFAPSGTVQPFFPQLGGSDSVAQLRVGESRVPERLVFRVDESDAGQLDSYVWFVTDEPAQWELLTAGLTRSSPRNSVESLFQSLHGRRSRGATVPSLGPDQLATRAFAIAVESAGSP
jgi:hypothetical protein